MTDGVTMLGRTDSRRRLLVMLVVFLVIGASLCSRLVWWQIVRHDDLAAMARRQTTVKVEEPVRRGTIYDRTGTVVLATTITRYQVAAAADQLTQQQRRDVGTELAGILQLNADDTAILLDKIEAGRPYVILAKQVDEATATKIRDASVDGTLSSITLEPVPERSYPQDGGAEGTTLAAALLGFVNSDGQGQYGVEEKYQAQLAGTPRELLADRDVVGRPITDTAQVLNPGVPGADLRLTLDTKLQQAVEQEVLSAFSADGATGVSAIVMDPYTGAIYSSASYPSYDANDYRKVAATNPGAFVDPNVSVPFEPGSVFKMMTAEAALEQGSITLDSLINDTGSLSLDHGAARIYDADRTATGLKPARWIVAYSRNVGAARIAIGLGRTTVQAASILAAEWIKLGFGRKSGVDLAGEASGVVRDPAIRHWSQTDLANGAFGQGVSVTELQLATAYAAMVNGGTLVTPHVVLGIGDQDVQPVDRGRVMTSEMSHTLVDLMHYVVHEVPWYKAKTLVKGYEVGGKTGTAQIWDPKLNHGRGSWISNRYNHTFVGYIGRGRPELIVVVTIRKPVPMFIAQGNLPLAVESYELFRRIATDAMTTLDLPAATAPTGR